MSWGGRWAEHRRTEAACCPWAPWGRLLCTSLGHHPVGAQRGPHFCTLGSGRFSRWMTMWAW